MIYLTVKGKLINRGVDFMTKKKEGGRTSALVLALMLGLAAANTKAETVKKLLNELQKIVLYIVQNIVIPILPVFIATTFAGLSYEGSITRQLPVFVQIILLVILGHFIWLITFIFLLAYLVLQHRVYQVEQLWHHWAL